MKIIPTLLALSALVLVGAGCTQDMLVASNVQDEAGVTAVPMWQCEIERIAANYTIRRCVSQKGEECVYFDGYRNGGIHCK